MGEQQTFELIQAQEKEILQSWLGQLRDAGALQTGRIKEPELVAQCTGVLRALPAALQSGTRDIGHPALAPLRELLGEISRSRALQGFSPRETAMFVFSLKQPLVEAVERRRGQDAHATLAAHRAVGELIDSLALHTMETYMTAREEVIVRQQQEIAELSTPVIKLWKGILALPLIGTLDSQRTQVVMENLLETIVAQGAEMAIIDITGVATVDTLTAQHLLKTVAAARLMGADCIISGIRPQIAQTMVHLGIELSVISKASLADAFALALARQGRGVVRLGAAAAAGSGGAAAAPPAPAA